MSPFEMAWRLLKGDDDPAFAEHRRMIGDMQQQEARVREQAQAQAPTMTPQALSYQQQLDAKREQEEHAQRVTKKMRTRLDRLRERGD